MMPRKKKKKSFEGKQFVLKIGDTVIPCTNWSYTGEITFMSAQTELILQYWLTETFN